MLNPGILRRWWRRHFGRLELSYSRLRAYLDCPWLYRTIYVERKRPPLTPSSSLGLSVHRALELYHGRKARSWERLLEFYDACWLREGYESQAQSRAYYERGFKMLRGYWDLDQERKSEVLFVEKEFSFPLGRHRLRGIIDRVDAWPDGTYEVIDYKTVSELWSEERLKQDLQLSIYGLALRRVWNLLPARLSIYFLDHGRILGVPYHPQRDGEVEAKVLEVARGILEERFEPDASHCPSCDLRQTCPYSVAKGPPLA